MTGAEEIEGEVGVPGEPDPEALSREDWLVRFWHGEGEAPPLPEVVRHVTPDDQMTAWAQCLIDSTGFPVELSEDGRSYGLREGESIPASQVQSWHEAEYLCMAAYPLEPKYYQPYNDAQLHAWYDHLTGEATRCITEQGHPVPQPPSAQTWVDGYRSQVRPLWHPFHDAINSESEHNRVSLLCPLYPDNFFDLASVPEE